MKRISTVFIVAALICNANADGGWSDVFTLDTRGVLTVEGGTGSGSYTNGSNVEITAYFPDGFHFVQWGGDTQYVENVFLASSTVTMPTNDVTLTATWAANEYTVTFATNGGEVEPADKLVMYDGVYGELPVPDRTGYTFAGWQAETNGVVFGVIAESVVAVAEDHTLTAAWAANEYTVTFDAQGGEVVPENKIVTYDGVYGDLPVPVLPAPIRVDYVFGGWLTMPEGGGYRVDQQTTVTIAQDHTLYARWVAESYVCDPGEDEALETIGNYTGYFFSDRPFSDDTLPDLCGTFSLSLRQVAGRLTAKAVTRKGAFSFSAKSWDAVEDEDGTKQVSLTRRGGETLLLRVRQNRVWGELSGGTLSGETFILDGSRNRFADRKDRDAQAVLETYKGYYTVALTPFASDPSGFAQATPTGNGYLTLNVGNTGRVRIAGILADGTRVSQYSTLILFNGCGPEACVPFFVPLYYRKGSVGALLWFMDGGKSAVITDRDLGWFVRWDKPSDKVDGGSVLLDAVGGYYDKDSSLSPQYLLYAGSNDVLYSYNGGVAEMQADALPNGITVMSEGNRLRIGRGTKPVLVGEVYDYTDENSAMATLSFSSRTGIFKGKFNLYYDFVQGGRLIHKAVSVPFAGILTQARADIFADYPLGQGYYLVPENDPDLKPLRIQWSYPIWMDDMP